MPDAQLDNPVWSCLATRHAHLALGGELARRYLPEISPIAGIPCPAPANVAALEALFGVGDVLATAGAFLPVLSSDWETMEETRIDQMVRRETTLVPEGDAEVSTLTAADADAMLALVDVTHPGPFRARTMELGTYLGIRERGRLVAMAGERMWIGDHREISAVCTHPDAQGRGYARALIGRLINRLIHAGQIPFLHVESANARAIAVYRTLGFVERAEFPVLYAKRTR